MAIGIIDELFLLLSSLFFYLDLNVTFTAQTSVLQSISLICAGNLCLIDDNLWLWQFSLVFNASELECFKRLNWTSFFHQCSVCLARHIKSDDKDFFSVRDIVICEFEWNPANFNWTLWEHHVIDTLLLINSKLYCFASTIWIEQLMKR